jgi:hypothetical protein
MAIEIGDTCKHGHEISGDNIQYYVNQGKQRVRCAKCNQPPRHVNPAKKPGDICKNGHQIVGDNVGEKKTSAGISYFCKECRRNSVRIYSKKKNVWSSKEQEQADRNKTKAQLQAARRAAERADDLITSGKEENALNYLKLTRRAERASDALQKAMLTRRAKCADNPGPWIDYDEENPPSKNRAYLMCVDCPVLVECARFASAHRPAIGVWGGEVYEQGKILYK